VEKKGTTAALSDLYRHSIRIILENQAPSGAYIASPNFSQYSYCWFRDSTYIAYAMDLVGEHESAARFFRWAAEVVRGYRAQVERAIETAGSGQMPAPEDLLHTRYTLDGQVGTDDWPNFQLDGFGTLLWGLEQHSLLTGAAASPETLEAVDLLARYLGALWRFPCYDCWEEFSDKIHTATLAAIFGGLQSASRLLGSEEHAKTAEDIREFVKANCIIDSSLSKFVGSTLVDASLLHVATPYRLLEPTDPLMQATVERIKTELRAGDGGVHRYLEDSYYGGGEWVLLTAYLGWHQTELGQTEPAETLIAWIEENAGRGEVLPEQVPAHLNYPEMLPVWEERWGPIAAPLLWSHAAYLTLRYYLDRAS
jgi:GH15 family glucan-1,4-alpha-glucosidase